MVLKRAKLTPRLSLSRTQTLKSLSQVFGLVEWLKGYPCRRGDRLALSREKGCQPRFGLESCP